MRPDENKGSDILIHDCYTEEDFWLKLTSFKPHTTTETVKFRIYIK